MTATAGMRCLVRPGKRGEPCAETVATFRYTPVNTQETVPVPLCIKHAADWDRLRSIKVDKEEP